MNSLSSIVEENLIIIMVIGFTVVMSIVIINFEFNDKPAANQEKELINSMDCKDLKQHIINDDMKYYTLKYLEHQYVWRCEK